MKILLAFPQNDGQTGVALQNAFTDEGCEVHTVNVNAMRQHELLEVCETFNGEFDLVLTSRTLELFDQVQQIKIDHPDIKTAMWNTDVRESIREWGQLIQFIASVDYYFVVAEGVLKRWQAINPFTFWVPQGIQTEKYRKVEAEKKYEAGFIGGCNPQIHQERIGIIAEMLYSDIDFHWYTNVYDDKHNEAVAECSVNLACSAYPEIDNCWSVRNWKIVAAGGILLEREHPGIKKYFQGNIETYTDGEDAVKKCKKILQHREKWEKKAEELRLWALENHTYRNRVKQILEIIS